MQRLKLGFVGLGIMGRPMALNLRKAGFEVCVWARRAASMQPLLEAGAIGCASAADVARQADIIISMVADAPDVAEVALGEHGVAAGAAGRSGVIFIDMSTIAPAASRDIAVRLAEQGITMLDAPVSGGEPGAINASLTIMVGGDEAAFARALPAFEAMGKTVTWMGSAGAGQVAKACNQILTGVGVASVAEAFLFARRNGVDGVPMREVLLGGLAYSKILENHGARMLARQFQPGFKAWMHQKDMNIVLSEAHACQLQLPTTAAAAQLFNAMAGSDLREQDSIALLRLLERMTGDDPDKVADAGAGAVPATVLPAAASGPDVRRIGVIGLGVMGRPIAENLLKAGFAVQVWARRPQTLAPLQALGAEVADSPAALAAACDAVITIVTASEDVRGLVCGLPGQPGLLAGARPGFIHVDMSTIAPAVARELGALYAARDMALLDAPVSGGGAGAQAATLAIMVGGETAALARVQPVLQAVGRTIVHVGPQGAGQITKACNQMMLVCLIQACAEAALLARAEGVDFARVRTGLLGGSANSRALEVMGLRMAEGNFAAGIEARLHHKDFGLLMRAAFDSGCPLPVASQVWQQLNRLMALGYGRDDTSSLFRVLAE